ncbi:hypothetical protein RF11_10393 [Thelohanellus kitauei]|uniref:Uncharacterized protein n=1 Tax=Thelohanellus kitauei TaxID=669202 RepID=A0A0C2ND58_THEKT|nr:hypothetical protein RF11_10393 [Thelohanellus kitauei]
MSLCKLSYSGHILTIDVKSRFNLTEPIIVKCGIGDMENNIRIEDCKITLTKKKQNEENFATKGGITVPKNSQFRFDPLQFIQFEFMGSIQLFVFYIYEFNTTTKDHDLASNEVIDVPLSKVIRCRKSLTGNDHECEFEGKTDFVKNDTSRIMTKTETKTNPKIVVYSMVLICLCLILASRKRIKTWLFAIVSKLRTRTGQYSRLIESS